MLYIYVTLHIKCERNSVNDGQHIAALLNIIHICSTFSSLHLFNNVSEPHKNYLLMNRFLSDLNTDKRFKTYLCYKFRTVKAKSE